MMSDYDTDDCFFFSQWSDIQKGYSKTRDYSEQCDFAVVADAHAHPRDTWVPRPLPHEGS